MARSSARRAYRDRVAKPRVVDPEGLYHVMSRGNFRQPIFLDDDHYAKYTRLLDQVTRRRKWTVLDWCLIPNHYHLLLQLTDGGLSEGMRELNGCYARWSNIQTGRTGSGHLVKNRFAARQVVKERHFWATVRYIPLNPVRADLAKRPEDCPWSGYRASVGLEYPMAFHRPAELLRYFSPDPAISVERYIHFVDEGLVPKSHAPWSDHVLGGARAAPA
jgi:putative transposase